MKINPHVEFTDKSMVMKDTTGRFYDDFTGISPFLSYLTCISSQYNVFKDVLVLYTHISMIFGYFVCQYNI